MKNVSKYFFQNKLRTITKELNHEEKSIKLAKVSPKNREQNSIKENEKKFVKPFNFVVSWTTRESINKL